MKKQKQSFFLKKSVVMTFGIVALLAGFGFLNEAPITGRVTGNLIASNLYPFSFISIIGIFLIICSAILIIYAIIKK